MSALYPNGTNSSFPPTDSNVSSAMIISFEVVFSVAIFGIIIACYFVGIRRRKRLREARSREYDTMVERALTRQQEQPRPFSHHQAADSSSTLDSYFNHRPPPYSPPTADDPSCQRLSERDVSRLSQAMLTNHINQQSNSSHLPRYNDLIRNNENNNNDDHHQHQHQRQLHEHASSLSPTTSIQIPPMAITRPFHSSSTPADPPRTETDLISPKLPQE
ncbi:hypothetical protein BCR42DRAFT_452019 [Absidia repens]|uniref:Uncharacterized protein n=1 Tax=Absidia repens TaxID=90262 RepID=A0A1X2IG34_9FUNG|nr:hypothetical protein BCR42DRAFT_452019 [Absidia repens]